MKTGIIGFGNLGKALHSLLLRNGYNPLVSDAQINVENKWTIDKSDVLFLCVKPNEIYQVLNDITSVEKFEKKLIVSCAARTTMTEMETELYGYSPIIRCMTNLPIGLGKGTITYMANQIVTPEEILMFRNILQGPTFFETDKEHILDLSTVLTGSMPAFIAYLSSFYIEFGKTQGLSLEESKKLYLSTLEGTLEMMKRESYEEIIRKVSSPNGVTQKGISFLHSEKIGDTIKQSLDISFQVSKKD